MSPLQPTVLIVGAGGQLGRSLTRLLPGATPLLSSDLDITSKQAVADLNLTDVDVLVNAAAYTAVDKAESDRTSAWEVNATGVANLARAAARSHTGFVHVSTEYVFDGSGHRPISVETPVCPLSVYGASKAAGELAATIAPRHWIVRTSWVIGDGGNFVRTMASLAERGVAPTVVADQVGRPTFSDDLATAILALTEQPSGTYHLTNTGAPTSWADLARDVFRLTGYDPGAITPVGTSEYFADKPGAAPRPLNSVLDLSKADACGVGLPAWQGSLERYLQGGHTR